MGFRRTQRASFAFALSAIGFLALGCESTPPPKPPPVAEAPKPPPDADGDGVPDDGTDKCLLEKEDGLPPEPHDGCKSTDPDGDGIVGDADRCPNEKEDGLPPDPKDGCKSVDPDGDGIIGDTDKCPDQPETKNDYEDGDGCPDTVPRVSVTKTEVRINDKILFAFGKAKIEAASQNLLDEIAYVINDNPQIEYLEVAGHADKVGTDPANVQLTKQRAQAVVEALVKRHVDKHRMHAQGYGRYCPLDTADTDAAREKNRRVEFKIMRVDGVETGVALGCAEAVPHGIKPAAVPKDAPHRADLENEKKLHPPTPPSPETAPPPAEAKGEKAEKPTPAPHKAHAAAKADAGTPKKGHAAAKAPATSAAPAKPAAKPTPKPAPKKK